MCRSSISTSVFCNIASQSNTYNNVGFAAMVKWRQSVMMRHRYPAGADDAHDDMLYTNVVHAHMLNFFHQGREAADEVCMSGHGGKFQMKCRPGAPRHQIDAASMLRRRSPLACEVDDLLIQRLRPVDNDVQRQQKTAKGVESGLVQPCSEPREHQRSQIEDNL